MSTEARYKMTGYDALASVLLSIPFALAYGWIVSKLWVWLLVPAGAPTLDYRVFPGAWWIAGLVLSRRFSGSDRRLASEGSPIPELIGHLVVLGGLSLVLGKLLALILW